MNKPVAVTPGEPAGIGPDITLKIAGRVLPRKLIVIADPELMRTRARLLGIDIELRIIDSVIDCTDVHVPGTLDILPVTMPAACTAGNLNSANASYVLTCLDTAVEHCMAKQLDALVNGPVHKGLINDAGIDFTGHTEYLAMLSASQPVMMLATDQLRVALVTTHLPLREVSDAIHTENLAYCIETLHAFLRDNCNLASPRILVCGLNPHAGEGGHLGREEIDIIQPVIEQCLARGMNIIGPLPADTLFTDKYLKHADAVLAMYHDQGLPALKYSGFGKAVNITLGLSFMRTSVDHGTALDLAGTGQANENSLLTAIEMAVELCK